MEKTILMRVGWDEIIIIKGEKIKYLITNEKHCLLSPGENYIFKDDLNECKKSVEEYLKSEEKENFLWHTDMNLKSLEELIDEDGIIMEWETGI